MYYEPSSCARVRCWFLSQRFEFSCWLCYRVILYLFFLVVAVHHSSTSYCCSVASAQMWTELIKMFHRCCTAVSQGRQVNVMGGDSLSVTCGGPPGYVQYWNTVYRRVSTQLGRGVVNGSFTPFLEPNKCMYTYVQEIGQGYMTILVPRSFGVIPSTMFV